jgi:hypothetical protein
LASTAVDWFVVHTFVLPLLDEVGSWPVAGSPPWVALADDDPRKIAALYDAARHHALRMDTEPRDQAARDISTAEDWRKLAAELRDHQAIRIRRRAS